MDALSLSQLTNSEHPFKEIEIELYIAKHLEVKTQNTGIR